MTPVDALLAAIQALNDAAKAQNAALAALIDFLKANPPATPADIKTMTDGVAAVSDALTAAATSIQAIESAVGMPAPAPQGRRR